MLKAISLASYSGSKAEIYRIAKTKGKVSDWLRAVDAC